MNRAFSLLVVDDDPSIRRLFTEVVAAKGGFRVDAAANGAEALDLIKGVEYDAAVVDLHMPVMGGMKLLEEARKIRPGLEIVMLTAHGSIESAVEAMKLGASDFLTKPFKLAQVMLVLDRVRRMRGLQVENEILRDQLRDRYRAPGIVGLTPAMERLNALVEKLRREDCSVLILGESGTGKELVARAIHFDGTRRGGPFVPIDCAAIHADLLESELFGHEKGAFTGAHARKAGLFEKAQGGTLFLDEVAELPLPLQPTLLRALEERRIRPVGGTQTLDVDVRIMAASNQDLDRMVERGEFRRDLYYRLNVVTLRVAPLRERRDDIPLLVEHFLKTHGGKAVSKEAMEVLLRHEWPGNVRELENIVERACALGRREKLERGDLPPSLLEAVQAPPVRPGSAGSRSLDEMEEEAIRNLLGEQGADTERVAKLLKIDRSTLYRKIRRYGIDLSRLKRT